jgi:hypothetical protein
MNIGIALVAFWLCQGGAAHAQTPGSAVGQVFEALHLRTTPPPAADFVERTRPDPESLDYLPLAPRDKTSKKKTPEQLDAIGTSLERAKESNLRAAGRVATPDASLHADARKRAKPKPTESSN